MRRVAVFVGVLCGLSAVIATPAFAQGGSAPSRSVAGEEDEDEADGAPPVDTRGTARPPADKAKTPVKEATEDEILAPVRTDGPATSVGPARVRDLKVGLMPVVALADAGKTLGDQLTSELIKSFNESNSVEFTGLALKGVAGGTVIDIGAATAAKAEGEQLLMRSKGLLGKLQFGKAKGGFEKALDSFAKAAPVLDDAALPIEGWLGLAEIAFRQANEDEAKRCLEMIVGFNPEYELDNKRFPGLFITTHRKVRDGLLKGAKSAILVDATATGAQLVIDGRPVSAAPAKASGLYPGQHLVRVLREGLAPWGTIVTVAAGAESSVSPGFFDPSQTGPGDDLAQNRFSPASAAVIAEAARAAKVKGGLVGVVSKANNRVVVQLVYVDAVSGNVSVLPQMKLQGDLLDIGIESLKARAAVEELAAAAKPVVAAAGAALLIDGARAGAGVSLTEVAMKFQVKASRDLPAPGREVLGVDADEDEGDRSVAESKTGTRKSIDGNKDRYSNDDEDDKKVVAEDAPFNEQPWFMPVVVTASVIGGIVVLGGTGALLVGAGVLPDPRPASGAQVTVIMPTAVTP